MKPSTSFNPPADLKDSARALLQGERDPVANAANLAALIFQGIADLNWAGFYFLRGDDLVLGPFQGRPACTRIGRGRGVCGAARERRETVVVPDVHAFPGHIACDSASRSELVVPLIRGGEVVGVLDVDSPLPNRFTDVERELLEAMAAIWLASLDGSGADSPPGH
jgi:GAF domain-containing protein